MKYELDRRKIRLYKITALYLIGFISAILAFLASIYIVASTFGPGSLLIYAVVAVLIWPSYELAKKKLKALEEREARVERELRRR
jgi:uncharacterized membrane protein YeiB